MPVRKYKPVTPGRRHASVSGFDEVSRSTAEKSLVRPLKRRAGRNSSGRITVRHRGGGHRRKYRVIDFRRDKTGIPATVAAIEYDPNRSARIALLHYIDGEKRYILAARGLRVGMKVMSGPEAEPTVGNALPLGKIQLGSQVHNLELFPGSGGKLVRGAGLAAQLMSREGKSVQVKLPSGEIRVLHAQCQGTVGQVGNVDHESVKLGKAGRKRWLGIRPTVRGVAMNPIDHPMGGGEGRSSGGGHPVSPWGQLAKGAKTRAKRKPSGKFIVKRRK